MNTEPGESKLFVKKEEKEVVQLRNPWQWFWGHEVMPFEVGLFKCQNWGRDSFVFSPKTPNNLYSIWLMKWEIHLIIFVCYFQISPPGNILTACRLGPLPDNVNVEYEAQMEPNRERLGEVIIRISMFTNSSDICPQHTMYIQFSQDQPIVQLWHGSTVLHLFL